MTAHLLIDISVCTISCFILVSCQSWNIYISMLNIHLYFENTIHWTDLDFFLPFKHFAICNFKNIWNNYCRLSKIWNSKFFSFPVFPLCIFKCAWWKNQENKRSIYRQHDLCCFQGILACYFQKVRIMKWSQGPLQMNFSGRIQGTRKYMVLWWVLNLVACNYDQC